MTSTAHDSNPGWVTAWSDEMLRFRFGDDTWARAKQYVIQQRLSGVQASNSALMARVRGNSYRSYSTFVTPKPGGSMPEVTTSCTCPLKADCKHAVALLMQVRDRTMRQATPSWRRTFDPLTHQQVQGSFAESVGLALEFNRTSYGVSVRPLKYGPSGRWVKTGASWDDVRFGFGSMFDPAQREALMAVADARKQSSHSYGARIESLALGDLRPEVWTALRRARDAGVTFLGGIDEARRPLPTPEVLDADVVATLVVTDAADGLVVQPTLQLPPAEYPDGTRTIDLLGSPPHGCAVSWPERFLLAPLDHPLSNDEVPIFRLGAPIEVPADDVRLFATGYLPKLRRHLQVVVDDDVVLPEPDRPQLVCRLAVASDARSADVSWGFRYGEGPSAVDVALVNRAGDPPERDADAEAALMGAVPEGPWRTMSVRGRPLVVDAHVTGRALFALVSDVIPVLEALPDVIVEAAELPTYTHSDAAVEVAFSVGESNEGDWFDLGVEVTIDGEHVPYGLLFAALAHGDDHVLLESGTWFNLDRPELEQLRELIDEARQLADHNGEGLRLRPEHAGLWEELVALGVVTEQAESWRTAVSALLDPESLPETPTPAGINAELRPYQQTGFRWLSYLWQGRLGGILADEMGLGKTLQALALVQSRVEAGELDAPALVVAPTSVIDTWASEAAKFAPGLRTVAVKETIKRRGAPLADAIEGAQLVLTSYTLLRLEADDYAALPWSAVFCDEAQFVKNRTAKAYKAVRTLRARTKIALTGTPLENNLMDLWSLLSITAPGLFLDPAVFGELYRKPIEAGDSQVLAKLHRRTRPLMLRRTKAAVAKELPDKQEQVLPVELAPGHRRLYDKHLARERAKVLKLINNLSSNRITILRSLTLLRQLSLSPALIDDDYPAQSAKLDTLIDMLDELTPEGHRALVFSQFTGFLKLARQRLDAHGVGYQYLDGHTRDRAARVKAFREGTDPVFLISLKAGGFGLTLTEADYVFILDPWWNPASENQAIDRTHRIGQDKPVNVYRMVSADTIEEKVVALQQRKRDLFDAVVSQASDIAAPLSADDIRGLLDA